MDHLTNLQVAVCPNTGTQPRGAQVDELPVPKYAIKRAYGFAMDQRDMDCPIFHDRGREAAKTD